MQPTQSPSGAYCACEPTRLFHTKLCQRALQYANSHGPGSTSEVSPPLHESSVKGSPFQRGWLSRRSFWVRASRACVRFLKSVGFMKVVQGRGAALAWFI